MTTYKQNSKLPYAFLFVAVFSVELFVAGMNPTSVFGYEPMDTTVDDPVREAADYYSDHDVPISRPPDDDDDDKGGGGDSSGSGGHPHRPHDDHGGGGGDGPGYTITQAEVDKALETWRDYLDSASSMTSAQAAAYAATLSGADKLAFEIARGAVTGRGTVVNGDKVVVTTCSNGRGGTWLIEEPPVVKPPKCTGSHCDPKDPPKNTPASCQYLLANGRAGNVTLNKAGKVTLSWQTSGSGNTISISPKPGSVKNNVGSRSISVNKSTTFELTVKNNYGSDKCAVQVNVGSGPTKCTDADATNYLAEEACTYPRSTGNPTVSAVIEALVDVSGGQSNNSPAVAHVGTQPDTNFSGVYSGNDRYVSANKEIYLRWKGVQSNGKVANYCTGTVPGDFTAPGHAAIGSFENGDGRGKPYPGLANGESKTYTVRCFNDYGSATDSVTLTGVTDFTNLPPTITANGKEDVLVVPYGTDVDIAWNPQNNPNCSLSNNLSGADASQAGSKKINATGESTYTINCGTAGSSSVRIIVLPVLEET